MSSTLLVLQLLFAVEFEFFGFLERFLFCSLKFETSREDTKQLILYSSIICNKISNCKCERLLL